MWYGIVSILTHTPMRGRFSITSRTLPTHIEAMRPQTSAGCSVITSGPA